MSNQPTKPFILEFAEAKNKIISATNEAMQKHNISCTLLESVLADILQQIKAGAKSEKETAICTYSQQLAEYEKSNAEKTEEEAGGENNGLGA